MYLLDVASALDRASLSGGNLLDPTEMDRLPSGSLPPPAEPSSTVMTTFIRSYLRHAEGHKSRLRESLPGVDGLLDTLLAQVLGDLTDQSRKAPTGPGEGTQANGEQRGAPMEVECPSESEPVQQVQSPPPLCDHTQATSASPDEPTSPPLQVDANGTLLSYSYVEVQQPLDVSMLLKASQSNKTMPALPPMVILEPGAEFPRPVHLNENAISSLSTTIEPSVDEEESEEITFCSTHSQKTKKSVTFDEVVEIFAGKERAEAVKGDTTEEESDIELIIEDDTSLSGPTIQEIHPNDQAPVNSEDERDTEVLIENAPSPVIEEIHPNDQAPVNSEHESDCEAVIDDAPSPSIEVIDTYDLGSMNSEYENDSESQLEDSRPPSPLIEEIDLNDQTTEDSNDSQMLSETASTPASYQEPQMDDSNDSQAFPETASTPASAQEPQMADPPTITPIAGSSSASTPDATQASTPSKPVESTPSKPQTSTPAPAPRVYKTPNYTPRSQMSEAEREAIRAAERERTRRKIAQMSPAEYERYLARRRKHTNRARANKTPEEKARAKEAKKKYYPSRNQKRKERLAAMTPEEREAQREKDRQRRAKLEARIGKETLRQKHKLVELRYRERLAADAAKKAMLIERANQRRRDLARRAAEGDPEALAAKKRELAKIRERARRRRARETPEEKAARLVVENERAARRRARKKAAKERGEETEEDTEEEPDTDSDEETDQDEEEEWREKRVTRGSRARNKQP